MEGSFEFFRPSVISTVDVSRVRARAHKIVPRPDIDFVSSYMHVLTLVEEYVHTSGGDVYLVHSAVEGGLPILNEFRRVYYRENETGESNS